MDPQGNINYQYPSFTTMQANLKALPPMPVRDIGQELEARKKGSLIAGLAGLLLGGAAGLPPIVGAEVAAQGLQQNLTGLQDRANQATIEQYQNRAQQVQAHNAMVRQRFADQMGQAGNEQTLRQSPAQTQTNGGTSGGPAMVPLREQPQLSQPSEHAATRRMTDAHYYAMRDAILGATGRGIT